MALGGVVGRVGEGCEVLEPDRSSVARVEREIGGLVAAEGGRSLLAKILAARGIAPEKVKGFLEASLRSSLRPPELMLDLPRAAERLARAIGNRERIVVYGDYDVDGLAGTAELLLFLRSLGVESVVYIPDRLDEGYGLNENAIRDLARAGGGVLVTVDCGTNATREIPLATHLGFDVIVCDHHEPSGMRPPAYAVVNPKQAGCEFPFKGLCAAGVVFYLLAATRRRLRGSLQEQVADLRQHLDLVALATIADVAPLVEENRALVRFGLRQMGKKLRPGIAALLDVSKIEVADAESIAFQVAPRINAAGRVGHASVALELLTTDDRSRAVELAAELERHNQMRRSIEAAMLKEAVVRYDELARRARRSSIVLWSEGWHPGVAGIVAARLAERYGLPAVVIAVEGGVGRGSGRTAGGVPLNRVLERCAKLCERAGGHEGAIGLTISSQHLPDFAEAFEEAVGDLAAEGGGPSGSNAEVEVEASELSGRTLEALELLEPCGVGNPAPVLFTRGLRLLGRRVTGGNHLILDLCAAGNGSEFLRAIGFGMADRANALADRVDCVYRPRVEHWRGSRRVKLYLQAVRSSGGREDWLTS